MATFTSQILFMGAVAGAGAGADAILSEKTDASYGRRLPGYGRGKFCIHVFLIALECDHILFQCQPF